MRLVSGSLLQDLELTIELEHFHASAAFYVMNALEEHDVRNLELQITPLKLV